MFGNAVKDTQKQVHLRVRGEGGGGGVMSFPSGRTDLFYESEREI